MKKILIFVGLCSTFLLSTCRKDVYVPDLCFSDDVLPIFVSNCAMSGCHNSIDKKEGYDLSNYEGIMKGIKPGHPLKSEIYETIKGSEPEMPQNPYPKLSAKDVNTIKLWIQMGALNSSDCSACDTSSYTYSGRINGIMQTWCVGCHSPTSSGGGFDLSNYTGVVNSIANNKLLGSINHQSGFFAMPQGAGKLSQCDIDAITKWVNAGYPNN